MRCASWGHEVPSDKPHESLDRAALGLDDQEVSCPAYLSDPHRQITPVISAAASLGQWVEDNAREYRLHRLADQQGLQLGRSGHRDACASDSGRYELATAEQDGASRGSNLPVKRAEAITLDEGESYPVYGTIRAEIMEYLSQTYGPVFVEDLIKHLPQPG
jgi:hypothetical protein